MSNRATRREILAALALADAAVPCVDFMEGNDEVDLQLKFESIADAEAWLIAHELDGVDVLSYLSKLGKGVDDRPYQTFHAWPDWRGWHLDVYAVDRPAAGEPLDDDTRARLAAVVDGGETA